MHSSLLRAFSLASLLVPLSAMAQVESATDPVFQSRLLNSLHEANLLEIAAARMAITRGSTPAIRQYAGSLVQDHTTADTELVALAEKLSVVLPSAAPPSGSLNELGNFSGTAFDRAFVKMMLDAHDRDMSLVQGAQPREKSGALSAYLDKLLPVLEQHRSTAMELNQGFPS